MSEQACIACGKTKIAFICGLCEKDLCKACTEFLDEETFSFQKETPPELSHKTYCGACYDAVVSPALESYQLLMERAEKVSVFFKSQKTTPPIIRQAKARVSVQACPDRDETILRLAFLAVELSFNGIIDVDISAEKIRNAGYQKTNYRGSAIPAQINESKLYWLESLE
jgi:hypothetical protein